MDDKMKGKGKGWHGQPIKHSLAAQGIKTKAEKMLPDRRKNIDSDELVDSESRKIRNIFLDWLEEEEQEIINLEKEIGTFDEDKWKSPFADVQVYDGKDMEHNYHDEPNLKGTISTPKEKDKDSPVKLLVTYDGAGYDYLNYSREMYRQSLEDRINKELSANYYIEDETNWAFSIVKD